MRTSTGKPTKAQQRRFDLMRELGCLCCRQLGHYSVPEFHHVLSGGRRIGHDAVLPLCPAHHRFKGKELGPSIADGSKAFARRWGTQRELLEQVNKLIGC